MLKGYSFDWGGDDNRFICSGPSACQKDYQTPGYIECQIKITNYSRYDLKHQIPYHYQ
jgi:hypothetical protein